MYETCTIVVANLHQWFKAGIFHVTFVQFLRNKDSVVYEGLSFLTGTRNAPIV